MKQLYRKFIIPSFDRIVGELLNVAEKVNYTASKEVRSWVVPINDTLNECPVLKDFLQSRLKRPIRQIKFYYSPPMQGLGAHVDGSSITRIPFSMNCPLLNTKGTSHYWHDCPPENTKIIRAKQRVKSEIIDERSGSLVNWQLAVPMVEVPIDRSIMPVLDMLEMLTPAIVKTDIMHSAFNPNETGRLIVAFRWGLENIDYSEPEDVIDLEDLYV